MGPTRRDLRATHDDWRRLCREGRAKARDLLDGVSTASEFRDWVAAVGVLYKIDPDAPPFARAPETGGEGGGAPA